MYNYIRDRIIAALDAQLLSLAYLAYLAYTQVGLLFRMVLSPLPGSNESSMVGLILSMRWLGYIPMAN